MQGAERDLVRIKGIGEVLAGRLVEAGLDNCEKIAAAGPEALGRIRGVNRRMVPAILAQAAQIAGTAPAVSPEGGAGLREAAERLRQKVEGVAHAVNERFSGEDPGRRAKKVEKQILKLIELLDRIVANPERRPKKIGRRLAKAEGRLDGIEGLEPAEIARKLKKNRRKLRKTVE